MLLMKSQLVFQLPLLQQSCGVCLNAICLSSTPDNDKYSVSCFVVSVAYLCFCLCVLRRLVYVSATRVATLCAAKLSCNTHEQRAHLRHARHDGSALLIMIPRAIRASGLLGHLCITADSAHQAPAGLPLAPPPGSRGVAPICIIPGHSIGVIHPAATPKHTVGPRMGCTTISCCLVATLLLLLLLILLLILLLLLVTLVPLEEGIGARVRCCCRRRLCRRRCILVVRGRWHLLLLL
jgi:hypothetical protein